MDGMIKPLAEQNIPVFLPVKMVSKHYMPIGQLINTRSSIMEMEQPVVQ